MMPKRKSIQLFSSSASSTREKRAFTTRRSRLPPSKNAMDSACVRTREAVKAYLPSSADILATIAL